MSGKESTTHIDGPSYYRESRTTSEMLTALRNPRTCVIFTTQARPCEEASDRPIQVLSASLRTRHLRIQSFTPLMWNVHLQALSMAGEDAIVIEAQDIAHVKTALRGLKGKGTSMLDALAVLLRKTSGMDNPAPENAAPYYWKAESLVAPSRSPAAIQEPA